MAIECYELRIVGLHFGTHTENVLHFNVDNGSGATSRSMASLLVTTFVADGMGPWRAALPPTYAVQRINAKRVLPTGGDSWWQEANSNEWAGSYGTTSADLSTAPVIRLYPPLGGSSSGRIFMPAVAESALVDNEYQGAYFTAINNLITALTPLGSEVEWSLAILSRKNGSSVNVSATAVSNVIGQQKRRRIPR